MNLDSALNTPIKRIKGLKITSPSPCEKNDENRMDIANYMVERGYSQRLTNNVLEELNSRALEISQKIKLPPPMSGDNSGRTSIKRFSRIHRNRFNQMDSISKHYSVTCKNSTPENARTLNKVTDTSTKNELGKRSVSINGLHSETKRRRTLTEKDLPLKPLHNADSANSNSKKNNNYNDTHNHKQDTHNNNHNIENNKNVLGMNTMKKSPIKFTPTLSYRVPSVSPVNKSPQVSPTRSFSVHPKKSVVDLKGLKSELRSTSQHLLKEDPIGLLARSTATSVPKISPSKRTYNLNELLSENKSTSNHTTSATISKSKIPQLSKSKKETDTRSASFRATDALPANPRHSVNRIEQPQRASLKKSVLTRSFKEEQQVMRKPLAPSISLNSKAKVLSGPSPIKKSDTYSSLGAQKVPINRSSSHQQITSKLTEKSDRPNYTIPQPFALYERQTISSSQKSLQKFKRFKERFN